MMDNFWRVHPKGEQLVGSKKRQETWDGRKLRAGCFKAYVSPLRLTKGTDIFDATSSADADDYEIVEFGGDSTRRDTDPEDNAVLADAWEERRRLSVKDWLTEAIASSDSELSAAAQNRLDAIELRKKVLEWEKSQKK